MRRLLRETFLHVGWWLRMEWRRGQSFATVVLFVLILLLVIGLLARRTGLPEEALRLFFWTSYTFTLFQAIPRPILDRRTEEWRWLHQLFSPESRAMGLWLYALLLSQVVGFFLIGGAWILWRYAPELAAGLIGGAALGLPLAFTALLAARAEASYAVAGVLGLPLLLFPLLWVCLRPSPPLLPLIVLSLAESLLFIALLPAVWRD